MASFDKWRRKLHKVRYLYRNGGPAGLAFCMAYRLAGRCFGLRMLRTVKVDREAALAEHMDRLGDYRFGYRSPAQLRPWADDPEMDLNREFLDRAETKGDNCFAIFEADQLVNYCWNSRLPTMIEQGLWLTFPPDYIYRYREYTRVSHRGRRLSSYSTAEALRMMEGSAKKGFVGYVEADNLVSCKTLKRKKHDFVGWIVVLGKGRAPWIWHSPGARRWGFRLSAWGGKGGPQWSSTGGQPGRKWPEAVRREGGAHYIGKTCRKYENRVTNKTSSCK